MSDWYRVLGPARSELADMGWASFRQPSGWLIEISLAEDCTEPPRDVESPLPDPCAWRHGWCYLVSPDGGVSLIGDEGDSDPAATKAAAPVDVAAGTPAPLPG